MDLSSVGSVVRPGSEVALAIGPHFLYTRRMVKATYSVHKKRKKMGRPKTGYDPAVTIRVPKEVLDEAMRWGMKSGYNRSTALAGLIERGLASLKDHDE